MNITFVSLHNNIQFFCINGTIDNNNFIEHNTETNLINEYKQPKYIIGIDSIDLENYTNLLTLCDTKNIKELGCRARKRQPN